MKIRKIVSVFMVLAIIASFGIVASAVGEDNEARISVSTSIDSEGYYSVNYNLTVKGGLTITDNGETGRNIRYSGSGIVIASIRLNGVGETDIYAVNSGTALAWDTNQTGAAFKAGEYFMGTSKNPATTVEGLTTGTTPLTILSIATNYEAAKVTEDEVLAKFSDFGESQVKIANVSEAKLSDAVNTVTTYYGVGEDGATKYVDADYVLGTPENAVTPDPKPEVKTVTKTDNKFVYNATEYTNEEGIKVTTEAQVGAALGLQFTKPAATLQPKMIWAVQTADGRRYSKPVAVSLDDVDGTITVAATFLNGNHLSGEAAIAPVEITGVDAIFTDGTNDYFTNADDAAAKKTTVSAE